MKTRFATLIAALTVAVAAQGDTPSPTQDIAIKTIDAATAFQSLRASFPDASGVVTAIKLDSNSLTVIADHPKAAELRKRLAEMDVSPKQIMIEAVITEVDADGSEKVTREVRTCLCLVDGIPVEIPWGKHLKLKITPTSVPYKAAELRKRLAEMDVRPKQIMIETVITEVDADGSEKVIARPCVCLVDGIPGYIALGENGKKHLKLKITPTSVPEVAAPKAVERAPEQAQKPAEPGKLEAKLNQIIIPRSDFEDTSLEEAVDFLRIRSTELDTTELDPAKKGVNFVIRRPAGAADSGTLRIKGISLRNVPLAVVLKYICDQTQMNYKLDDGAVIFVPKDTVESLSQRNEALEQKVATLNAQVAASTSKEQTAIEFDDPADAYFQAYLLIRESEKTSDQKESIRILKDALGYFKAVKSQFPDWRTSMVDARIKDTEQKLESLSMNGR